MFHIVKSSGLTKETILIIKSLKAYKTCLVWSIPQSHLGIKKLLPEWENAAAIPWYCHDHIMILPWSYHEQGEAWSWSCHDDGMAAMFLGVVVMFHGMITMFSMIHTMIMDWLPCFPCFWLWYEYFFTMFLCLKNELFVNVFSNSCCHIPFMSHLRKLCLQTAESAKFNEDYSRNEFSSVITRDQSLIWQ